MNPIETQQQIIDQLYWLVRNSVEGEFDTAKCNFDYQQFEDGSSSIGSRLSYHYAGNSNYGRLLYPDRQILDETIPQLHALMKAHTGGDWQAFTLTINKDGSVTTEFKYPDDAR